MPIYPYRCLDCGLTFTSKQGINEDPHEKCEQAGAECLKPDCSGRVERCVARSSFSLRGRGWYKDGYG